MSDVDEVVEIRIPAHTGQISLARLLVVAVAEGARSGFDRGRVEDLRIVVSEACTNAIAAMAAVGSTPAGTVLLRCRSGLSGFLVEVTDTGGGIPSDVLSADRSVDMSGAGPGIGLALIETLTDHHAIRTGPGGTTVSLGFGLPFR